MSDDKQAEKVHENRLRRMADRQGLALHKPRRRDRRAVDYDHRWLLRLDAPTPDRSDDAWIGPFRTLAEVEAWLDGTIENPGEYLSGARWL